MQNQNQNQNLLGQSISEENKENIKIENNEFQNNVIEKEKETENKEENLNKMDENQIILVKQILQKIQNNINQIFQIIEGIQPDQKGKDLIIQKSLKKLRQNIYGKEQKIIEGVFDGQNMISSNGKKYIVPTNYASKSKLIEGDILKLTIANDGSFIYKQTDLVQRERLKGILIKDKGTNQWEVLAGGNIYKVLATGVTYFKGDMNDEAIILVSKGNRSQWAAIENIIKIQN
ncbi:MAG: hypothetical protein AAB732_02090 [Patescibacteria group bacterium]